MTTKIFQNTVLIVVFCIILCTAMFLGVLYSYFEQQVYGELAGEALLAARGIELSCERYLEALDTENRLTLVSPDGTVLYDNREDPAQMENHADREEIHEAAMLGQGRAVRHSDTLSEKTIYYALRLSDGTILRVSDTEYSVWRLVIQAMQPMALVLVLAFVLPFTALLCGYIREKKQGRAPPSA